MTTRDQEEQDIRIEMMKTQHDLFKTQLRWETWKALAAFIAGVAVFGGLVLAVSNWLHPASQQPLFPPGTVITIPGAKP